MKKTKRGSFMKHSVYQTFSVEFLSSYAASRTLLVTKFFTNKISKSISSGTGRKKNVQMSKMF